MRFKHYLIKPVKTEHLITKVKDALAHEKPVLKDKNAVKSLFGLGEENYKEIVQTFSSMVSDKFALLEKRIKGETEEGRSLGLLELLESSTYLGAERIRILLKDLTKNIGKPEDEMKDSEYPLLLRELKILKDALSPPTPSKI